MRIRDASPADAVACAGIYGPYVRDTTISFELVPPTADEMAGRIAASQLRHAWLVAKQDGQVLGYAYGSEFKARAAYRFACEVSVYVSAGHRGAGTGRALYEALLPRLAGRGFRIAVAGMTVPNAASEALHRSLGFEPVGVFHRVGWKFDAWHDVAFAQRALAEPDPTVPASGQQPSHDSGP
ncbi:GNAT family N-acetyltransferase [uncultured Jatrophihabitans sp.]|uniref:GNAT family N-acetyltransferase n=1 Tax=uncultured Jatrophihabitans sp. TaxID=1610747 RepID=UPI0035C98568